MPSAVRALEIPSVKARVSAQEWQARLELACAYRLADYYGWTHLIYNHISLRVPGESGHFLLNPFGMVYREITASSMVKVDIDGKVVGESPFGVHEAGFVIHSAIHRAREDAHAVMHTHTIAGMAVSTLACGLLPITQSALKVISKTGYHDYEGISLELDERERLATSLGDNVCLILSNHGLLTVGRSVGEAFVIMYHLEKACAAQVAAMSCNSPLISLPVAMQEKVSDQNGRGKNLNRGDENWPAMMRLMDTIDPGYRD